MKRGIWLLAGLCLFATACSEEPPVRVTVLNDPPSAAAVVRLTHAEELDAMIPMVSVQSSADASPDSAIAPYAGPTGTSGLSAGSTAAVTISQSSNNTPADPGTQAAAPPQAAAATPKPATPVPQAATPVPKSATPMPPTVPGCQFSQALSEGDGIVRAAQTPPALFYGGDLCAGDKVEALIAGKSCATTTVNAAGQWSISMHPTAACGPTENAAVTLTVNGKAATVSSPVHWRSMGLPQDVVNGYTLTR